MGAAGLLWLPGCVTPTPPQVVPFPLGANASLGNHAPPLHLTLVGTNDLHGWVQPHKVKLPDGTFLEEGGLATFASYVQILRKENPQGTLLLDGGDLFQGTLVSNLGEGAVVVEAMNQLGFTASAIGNHEFDYGPVGPSPVATGALEDPLGALKARIAQARFHFLAVNLYEARTGQRPAWLNGDGTQMIDLGNRLGNVKVGLLGLSTPTTPQVTNPVNVASLRFGNLIPETLSAAKRLRDQGADVVVAVAHVGGKCAQVTNPHDLSNCDGGSEMNELLTGLPPGTLDAVIAGHTHAQMGHFINGTPVIETWGFGTHFGTIELYLDPIRKTVLPEKTEIHPVIPICAKVDELSQTCESGRLKRQAKVNWVPATFHGQAIAPDGAIEALLAPALARVESAQNQKLGIRVMTPLTRNYETESPLGDVLSDALRELAQADVALLNSGGLRADLPAGELTYGNVYEVMPFDNTLATLLLTGEELQRLLLSAYGARKGVFQQSGLQVTLSRCPGQGRLKAIALADGKPLQPGATYRVVLPDFLARGGDGLAPIMDSLTPDKVDLGLTRREVLRDALVSFWKRKGGELSPPKPGRITFLDDGNKCNAGAKLDVQSPSP